MVSGSHDLITSKLPDLCILITSLPPFLVNRAKFPDRGRCENPFAAVPGVKSLGEVISTDFEVPRLNMDNFKPNSEKMQTSSSVPPNEMKVGFVVPEVGLVIVAEK